MHFILPIVQRWNHGHFVNIDLMITRQISAWSVGRLKSVRHNLCPTLSPANTAASYIMYKVMIWCLIILLAMFPLAYLFRCRLKRLMWSWIWHLTTILWCAYGQIDMRKLAFTSLPFKNCWIESNVALTHSNGMAGNINETHVSDSSR